MKKVIVKGSFRTAKDSNYVTVKNYMMVEEAGRRYLLLKFFNARAETVTRIDVSVTQKDSRGKELPAVKLNLTVTNGAAMSDFVPDRTIPVSEECADFSVKVDSAAYGNYVYTIGQDGALSLSYERTDYAAAQNNRDSLKKGNISPQSGGYGSAPKVTAKRFRVPVMLGVMLLVMMVFSSLLGYSQIDAHRYNNNSFLHEGVRYSFVNNSRRLDGNIVAVGAARATNTAVIPEKIKGHTVVGVADRAFQGRYISSLIIEGAIPIGSNAFADCGSLTEVKIDKVTKIGDSAFERCVNLTKVSASNLSIIGRNAFTYSSKLAEVSISHPDKVLSIGARAFGNCFALTDVDIDQYIYYPMGESLLFAGSTAIKNLRLKNVNYTAPDGIGYLGADIKLESLLGTYGVAVTSLQIDYMDEIIEDFASSLYIQNITINNLASTEVGTGAFEGNSALRNLNVPVKFTKIGERAFKNTAISGMDGEKLTYIGKLAFADNSRFYDLGLYNNTDLEYIGEYAFRSTGLTSIYLPEKIKDIPAGLFNNSYRLSRVNTMSVIQSIGNYAFQGCRSLITAPIADGTDFVGEEAFSGCTSLGTVTLPQTLNTIGERAFFGCENLYTVVNQSSKNITVGSIENGYVAFYALRVTEQEPAESLTWLYNGSYEFVRVGGETYLVGAPYSNNLVLPSEFTYGGYSVDNYIIRDNIFSKLDYGSIFIPRTVTKIMPSGNSSWTVQMIMYEGSLEEWSQVVSNIAASKRQNIIMEYNAVLGA